ncbi:MAG: Aminopeptidase [Pedosphaera sp.]|nr:Aminopeptidase [Pedosphaera sp.]
MIKPRWFRLLAFLFLAALASTAAAEAPFSFAATPGQLPKTVIPLHYTIRLQPDLEKFITHGSVTIEVQVLSPVNEIVLNALEMEVTKATFLGSDSAGKPVELGPRLDADKQTLTLPLPEKILPGKYRIALEFTGKLCERAQGLFRVKYATPAGKKIMLATQMEPTDARRMFPCWDEPVFRATYALTVVVPAQHLAVSNMPIERQAPAGDGLQEITFQRTPPMASYLVVLVSGELEELKGKVDGVQIRIITTEGKREQGRYALEVTKKVLAYYNQYFGIKYPLPKLDQIAVPGGFGGAMENWGGITYNERLLLYDPATSSQSTRQGIFSVVSHEMAHQWFGDLVTTAWWDNLWLNEGFASWMAAKTTDHFNPDWQVGLSAASVKSGIMNEDARSTTHPILKPVLNESQANDAFDHITYQKGQSFLRMLENYLGEDLFRKGIRQYISDHRYSNTTTADLWAALEKASGKPVNAISVGWTEQPGLPVVHVRTACVDAKQVLTLEQERFTVQDPNAQSLQWQIPIACMLIDHPKAISFTLLTDKVVSLPFHDCGKVIKINAGDAGYYRVAYEPRLFQALQQRINELPALDRLDLLNDVWAMVEAGRAAAPAYLDLTQSLRDEKVFAIWNQIISTLDIIAELERGQPGRAAFREYACSLLRPQLQRLGWDRKPNESSPDSLLRSRVITDLGNFGDQAVIAQARARYENFLLRPESLAADLRWPVLTMVGRYSDRKTYDQLHELARNAKGTEERQLYYHALAAALDPELGQLTLPISLTDETVPQEATRLVSEVAGVGEQPELAWDFAQQHMPELLEKVETFRRNGYVPSILGSFCDSARADELEVYVRAHVSEAALVKARETAAGIRLKAALKQRELPAIDQWIAARLANRSQSTAAK